MTTLRTQLEALIANYKNGGMTAGNYHRMIRKAGLLAKMVGMDKGELLDMMIANN